MQLTASRRTQQRHTPPTADPEVRPTPSWSETCPICFRPKPGRVGMSCVQQAGAAACWLLCLRPVRSSTGSRWFVSRFWALKFRGLRPPDLPPVASREGLRCLFVLVALSPSPGVVVDWAWLYSFVHAPFLVLRDRKNACSFVDTGQNERTNEHDRRAR